MNFKWINIVRMLSELFATAVLLFVGCMGSMLSQKTSPAPLMQSSILFGATYIGILHCFTPSSGAHANPCITLACWLMGQMRFMSALTYWLAQMAGAFLGFYLVTLLMPKESFNAGVTALYAVVPSKELSMQKVFLIEYVLTAILIMGACSIWSLRNSRFMDALPLRLGFLLMALCLAGGNLTGANMNPALTSASAYFTEKTDHMQAYIGGQVAAAVTVPIVWKLIFYPITSEELC